MACLFSRVYLLCLAALSLGTVLGFAKEREGMDMSVMLVLID